MCMNRYQDVCPKCGHAMWDGHDCSFSSSEPALWNREELIKTISNLCQIHLIVSRLAPIDNNYLDTIDETIYENAQRLIEHCVKENA